MTKLLPMTEAEKQLAEKHLHLVPQIVSAMTRAYSNLSNEESEELTQIGYLALCRAATRYYTGRPFEPYAKVTIKHAIYDYWRACRRHKQLNCSLEELLSDDAGETNDQIFLQKQSAYQQTEATALATYSSTYLAVLAEQSSTVVQKGIAALRLQQQGYRSTDLAKLYGVPANHVRAWQSKARKKLKQNQELYALLA